MPPINGTFDATQFKPEQLGDKHPPGNFPATVSHTEIVPTKNQDGGMLNIHFKTAAGTIINRYNLWNASEKAVSIARGQLSALCHATGIFKLDFANEAAALRNARCVIDVNWQKGDEPTTEKPEGGYTEVKKVYDPNGNEPGRIPAAAPAPVQQQVQSAPMTQQGNGWQQQAAAQAPQGQQPNPGWGGATNSAQAAPGAPVNQAPPWAR